MEVVGKVAQRINRRELLRNRNDENQEQERRRQHFPFEVESMGPAGHDVVAEGAPVKKEMPDHCVYE
jgi:hypothetical protein